MRIIITKNEYPSAVSFMYNLADAGKNEKFSAWVKNNFRTFESVIELIKANDGSLENVESGIYICEYDGDISVEFSEAEAMKGFSIMNSLIVIWAPVYHAVAPIAMSIIAGLKQLSGLAPMFKDAIAASKALKNK